MLYLSVAQAADGSESVLHRMIADPGLGALLEMQDEPGEGAAGFRLLRGLLARATGEIELALLGIAPPLPGGAGAARGNRPLLILRARLSAADAARLREVLAGGEVAVSFRSFQHGTERVATYQLRDGEAQRAGRPDFAVEVAVVGDDLLATNDGLAMSEVLGAAHTGAAARRTLAQDERFQELRARLPAPAGSVQLYGDWPRLGRRLQAAFGGMPGFLLEHSGLGSAKAVLAVIEPRGAGLAATALLDFAADSPAETRPATRPEARPDARQELDGWLTLLQQKPARALVAELPAGGLGGLVLAVDPAGLARSAGVLGARGMGGILSGLGGQLADGCRHHGMDFEQQVLSRLGRRGSMQFLLLAGPGEDGRPGRLEIASAYAFAAKNRKAAQDLLADAVDGVRQHGGGKVIPGAPGRRGEEQIELSLLDQDAPARMGVIDDAVVFAFHPAVLGELRDELQRGSRTRARRDADTLAILQALGAHKSPVAGVFALDAQPLLDRAAQEIAARGTAVELSRVPSRYVGFVDVQQGRNGAPLLRIQLSCSN